METEKKRVLLQASVKSIDLGALRSENKSITKALNQSQMFNDYIENPEKGKASRNEAFV